MEQEIPGIDEEKPTQKTTTFFLCDISSIKVLNEQFNLVKTIQTIDGKAISPSCITSNQLDRIFINDLNNETIMACDFDFKLVKQVGAPGSLVNNFDNVSGLAYSKQYLYACDTYNQRIQCFNALDLSFVYSIQFDFEPEQLKIYNNMACILGNSTLYFYDLNGFNLIEKYDSCDTCIGLINEHFIYELNYETNKLIVYSMLDASCLKDLNDSLGDLTLVEYDDRRCVTCFNGKLVVTLSVGKLYVF